jgi:hypothetical protein
MTTLIEAGNVGIGRYEIYQGAPMYRVFIGGIYRCSKKTIRGAYGVLRKIDRNFASDSTLRMRSEKGR